MSVQDSVDATKMLTTTFMMAGQQIKGATSGMVVTLKTFTTTLKTALNPIVAGFIELVKAVGLLGHLLSSSAKKLAKFDSGLTKVESQLSSIAFSTGNQITAIGTTSPAAPAPAKKNPIGDMFNSIGTAIKGAMGTMLMAAVVLEPVMAMMGAFLEPLESLTPVFEMFGAILSQDLVPIMPPLINLFMTLIPLIMSLVVAFMPITNLIVGIINTLIPVIQIVISIIIVVVNTIGMLTQVFNVVAAAVEWVAAAFTGISKIITDFFGFISNGFSNIINVVGDMFTGWIDSARQWARDLLKNGFDGDPNTWW